MHASIAHHYSNLVVKVLNVLEDILIANLVGIADVRNSKVEILPNISPSWYQALLFIKLKERSYIHGSLLISYRMITLRGHH